MALKRLVDPTRPITYGIVQAGEDVEGGVPYIRPVDMASFARDLNPAALRTTAPEIARAYSRSTVRAGDLVLSIGPSYGKLLLVPPRLAGANLTQGTARLAPARGTDARFLQWVLFSAPSRAYWASVTGGATFGGLNLGPLSKTPVPSMSASRQAATADFLDHECERLEALADEARTLPNAGFRMLQARVREDLRACGGRSTRLRYVAQLQTGATPAEEDIRDSGVAWFTPHAFGVRLIGSPVRYYRYGAENLRGTNRASVGVVVIGATAGRVAYMPRGGCANQQVAILHPREADAAEFLCWSLWSAEAELASLAVKTTLPIISIPNVRSFRLPWADAARRDQLNSQWRTQEDQLAAISGQAQAIQALLDEYRDALITEAVTGKLDVTCISDQQLDESAHAAMEGERPEVLSA